MIGPDFQLGETADAGFGISEIHITGNRRTPYSQVLEVLGMKPGQSIFSADLYTAQTCTVKATGEGPEPTA